MVLRIASVVLVAAVVGVGLRVVLSADSNHSLRGGSTTTASSNLTAAYTLLDGVRHFRYYSYGETIAYLDDLERRFPTLVDITTAQQAYGLDSPGLCNSISGSPVACNTPIVRLTNEETLPDAERPEVFFSGCLHGNEYVGPITTVEMAIALVEFYGTSEWARRMLNTRAVYIMPFANSLGYEKKTRTENRIDPNRDFAYDTRK